MRKGSDVSYTADGVFIASAALQGVAALAIAAIGILSFFRIPIRGDAARSRYFLWFFAAVAASFTGYALGVAAYAICAFQFYPDAYASADTDGALAVVVAGRRLEPVARLVRRVAAALCIVAVTEAAASFSPTAAGVHRNSAVLVPRAAAHVSAAGAGVLSLAEFVLAERQVDSMLPYPPMPRLDDQFNTGVAVRAPAAAAILVLVVAAALALLTAVKARAAVARADTRCGSVLSHEKRSIDITLAAAGVLLVVRLWGISEAALLFIAARQSTNAIAWFYIADGVLDRLGTVLVLWVVYLVGAKSPGGLWSATASTTSEAGK